MQEGKQRATAPCRQFDWLSVLKQMITTRFYISKGILKMQSGITAAEPEILYQLLRGKAFVLESDIAGRAYI